MKKFTIIFVSILTIIFIPLFGSAETYTAYGSLADNNTTANNLINYYINSENFNFLDDFIVIRTSQFDYYLFYGDLDNNTEYIRYHSSNGINDSSYFTEGTITDYFSYHLGDYTALGSVEGTLHSSVYSEYYNSELMLILFIIITILILFSSFKFCLQGSKRL